MPKTSSSLSASPSSRARRSALTRSSRGLARRSAKRSCRYATNSPICSKKRSISSRSIAGVMIASDQRAEAILVGGRHAEELGDDGDRQGERVLGGEVHLAARLDGVEKLVGDRLDARAQLLDDLGRERLRDEAAQAAVILAVAVQHVVLDHLEAGRRRLLRELLWRQREPRIADEPLVVEQHGGDVVVPRHEPDHRLAVDARLAEDRVVGPHRGEDRVRVRAERRPVEVVLPLDRRPCIELTDGAAASLDSQRGAADAEADARVRRHRVPRLGAPAGRAHGGRRAGECAGRGLSGLERAGRCRSHRRRRPRPRPGREPSSPGRPARRASCRCAERRASG